MKYQIADYSSKYELQWLECMKETFYSSLYFDTILKIKPRYENSLLELVALRGNRIVGFLDIESIPPTEQLCNENNENCGQITLLGVHPLYRRQKIATQLLHSAIVRIKKKNGIKRLEASFREDEGVHNWFLSMEFKQCEKYYEVSFSQDFFMKYGIDLPFGINPSILTGFVDQSGFRLLTTDHPPEKTFPYLIMEKLL